MPAHPTGLYLRLDMKIEGANYCLLLSMSGQGPQVVLSLGGDPNLLVVGREFGKGGPALRVSTALVFCDIPL